MLTGEPVVHDGVAVLLRGDVFLVVYQKAARLHRSRWAFDRADEAVAQTLGGLIVFMIVLPTADPPDGPTRAENKARFNKLGPAIRRMVTTPIGDALFLSIVRTVMRAIAIVQGKSSVSFVTNSVDSGMTRVMEAAGPRTPVRSQLIDDVRALYRALGVEAPRLLANGAIAG